MEKEEKIIPESEVEKTTGPGSDPENKFKEGQTTSVAALDNIIKGAVENVSHRSSQGFSDKGTVPDYEDER